MLHRCFTLLLSLFVLSGCMDYEPATSSNLSLSSPGVFVISEGGFMYGNASLEHYHPQSRTLTSDVFGKANARALGDVAQSMTIYQGLGYVVVNNSGVIYIIDPKTGKLLGGIKGFSSPRYIHFVSPTKAYVTDLVAGQIYIIDPSRRQIIGRIPTPGHLSTERMVSVGTELWVSCWSYDRTLLVIDTATDTITREITVGIQPTDLVLDKLGMLWSVSTGGYPGSTYGYEAPTLRRISPSDGMVPLTYTFPSGSQLGALALSPDGDLLYYLLSGAVYALRVDNPTRPTTPLIPASTATSSKPYGIGVDPHSGDIYIADAIDYVQQGIVYRYNHLGAPLDTLRVGINPSSFCFVP